MFISKHGHVASYMYTAVPSLVTQFLLKDAASHIWADTFQSFNQSQFHYSSQSQFHYSIICSIIIVLNAIQSQPAL